MPHLLDALAAEAAATLAGGTAYTYGAVDAASARILVVEQGGAAFPRGSNIGAPDDDVTGKWAPILQGAGFSPGMYSWWNAIPCGLDRPETARDKTLGRRFLSRAIALRDQLFVVLAVGRVAQEVVTSTRMDVTVLTARSPLRTSAVERQRIIDTFVQARLNAYPLGHGTTE